jgi:hypothetical protein
VRPTDAVSACCAALPKHEPRQQSQYFQLLSALFLVRRFDLGKQHLITFPGMPSKKGDELLTHLEVLCAKYRIEFPGDLSPSQWPQCHRRVLENAQILGAKSYDEYATASGLSESEPWKVKVKSLAHLLVEKAGRLKKRNESTWRHACEPIILGRLESEVCWWVLFHENQINTSIPAELSLARYVESDYGGPMLK